MKRKATHSIDVIIAQGVFKVGVLGLKEGKRGQNRKNGEGNLHG
jgi:hypothetical protein